MWDGASGGCVQREGRRWVATQVVCWVVVSSAVVKVGVCCGAEAVGGGWWWLDGHATKATEGLAAAAEGRGGIVRAVAGDMRPWALTAALRCS